MPEYQSDAIEIKKLSEMLEELEGIYLEWLMLDISDEGIGIQVRKNIFPKISIIIKKKGNLDNVDRAISRT